MSGHEQQSKNRNGMHFVLSRSQISHRKRRLFIQVDAFFHGVSSPLVQSSIKPRTEKKRVAVVALGVCTLVNNQSLLLLTEESRSWGTFPLSRLVYDFDLIFVQALQLSKRDFLL